MSEPRKADSTSTRERRFVLALSVTGVMVAPVLVFAVGWGGLRVVSIALLIGAACIAVRRLLKPVRERGAELLQIQQQPTAARRNRPESSADDRRYLLPRLLYYFGMLTVALSVIRLGSALTLSDGIFVVALLALLFEMLLRADTELIFPRGVLCGALLITAGSLVSTLLAKDPAASLIDSLKYPYLMVVWFWMGTVVLRRIEHVYFAIACCLLSAAISSGAGFDQMFLGGAIAQTAKEGGRAAGLSEHVSSLGMTAAMALPSTLLFVVYSRGIVIKSAFVIGAILTLGGLLLSVSMGGLTGTVVSLGVWVVGFLPIKTLLRPRSMLLCGLLIAAAVGLFHFQSVRQLPTLAERFENLESRRTGRGTVDSRLETYQAAFDSFNRNPLVGVGRDPKSTEAVGALGVHNVLLLHLYEGGILGFLGIVILLLSLGYVIWQTAVMARTYDEWWLAISIMLSFVAFALDAMSEPVAHGRSNWVFAALAVGLYGFQQRGYLTRKRRALQSPAPWAPAGSAIRA